MRSADQFVVVAAVAAVAEIRVDCYCWALAAVEEEFGRPIPDTHNPVADCNAAVVEAVLLGRHNSVDEEAMAVVEVELEDVAHHIVEEASGNIHEDHEVEHFHADKYCVEAPD